MKKLLNKVILWLSSIPKDKILHENLSLILCLLLIKIFKCFMPFVGALVLGGVLTFAVGVIKELYDKSGGSKVDPQDLLWDAVGILIAFIVA